MSSTSFGKGSNLKGMLCWCSTNSDQVMLQGTALFIVAEAGVLWVCEQRHMCIIRLIRDARAGIPWIGAGAVGKAAFMLAREVSVRADMVNKRFR
jgi:hypothetical protein